MLGPCLYTCSAAAPALHLPRTHVTARLPTERPPRVVTRARLARSPTRWVFSVNLVSNPWRAPQEAPASALLRCIRCRLAEDSHAGRDLLTLAATSPMYERRENTSCPRLLDLGWKSKAAAKVDSSSSSSGRRTQGRRNLILLLALKRKKKKPRQKLREELLPAQEK